MSRVTKEQDPRLQYIDQIFSRSPMGEELAISHAQTLGKEGIQLSGVEAQILSVLLKMIGASRVLEIGTLTGRSTLWIAACLPDEGEVITIEQDPAIAELARDVFLKSPQSSKIQLQVGDARALLPTLKGKFDAVFIDANKAAYLDYLNWAMENVSPGGLIIGDNTFLFGEVLKELDLAVNEDGVSNSGSSIKQRQVMHAFNVKLASDPRFASAMLPTSEGMTIGFRIHH